VRTPRPPKALISKGQTIDIGVPAARDWVSAEVNRIVNEYHLDMLEHDGYLAAKGCDRSGHPHAPPDPARMRVRDIGPWPYIESVNSTDVSLRSVAAYYEIQQGLRRNHPGLLLEICNDGGRMVDFGSAAHGDYFSITDTYDPLSNRRAFFDASYVLPPAMLETYVEKWPAPRIENFRYMLRSGMMGWLTIMQDASSWTAEQRAAVAEEFRLYKQILRPLIRDASLYHISARPDGIHWDAIEYFDDALGAGAVYVFRGSTEAESRHTFLLRGLNPNREYQVQFHDHSSPDRRVLGSELLRSGIEVHLQVPNSSEVLLLRELP
jgi:alpha-galactosidase